LTCKADPAPKNDDKAVEMQDDFNAQLSDVSEDLEGEDSGGEDEDNLDNQMGDTGDASEVVGKKSWDKDEDDEPKTSIEKYESGSSAKGTEQDDRELRAKDDGSIEEDPMEMDSEEGKNNNLEHDPSTCDETDLNTDEVMDKADAYDDRTGPEIPEPENDSVDVDMEEQEQTDERDADNEDIGTEEAEQADERLDASDDMEEGDMAQHSDGLVDNEGEHVEDANTEAGEMDTHQLDKTDSLMPPSQGLQPDNMQVDSNRESEANLANSSDMHGTVAPSVNFSGNEVPNMEISMPNAGDDSRLLSNSKPDMQNDAQQHIKQTNPFRSIGDALEDWKERAKVSADTQDHQPETGNDSNENTAEFRYVPEGEQSTSQALGAATADQINDDNQINQSFLEDESRVRKLEQSDERTPDNPEMPYLRTSQALPSKSENANEFDGREIQTDTSVQNLVESRIDHTFQDLVSFKRPPADDKLVLIDLTTDREFPSQMDLDITDAETKRSIVDWKNLELATMKLSQELAEQLRLVMEPTLASKLQGDYRTGKRINMKKVLLFPMNLSLYVFLSPP
jgi:midasin